MIARRLTDISTDELVNLYRLQVSAIRYADNNPDTAQPVPQAVRDQTEAIGLELVRRNHL